MLDLISEDAVLAVLKKYADPILKKAKEISNDEFNKFAIEFSFAFSKYLDHAYEKYSKVKTVLYRTEPKNLYDFFEFPMLRYERQELSGENIDSILNISNFLIITGTGGVGKSTFMKHLFLSAVQEKEFIPIFLELKNLNTTPPDFHLTDFIFSQLENLGVSFDRKYLDYALNSGCFLFLMDGYDEILTDKKDAFYNELMGFCDKYSENCFVLSSRPYSDFLEFQRFSVLKLLDFSKEQALSMVRKLEYDNEIKDLFLLQLDEKLYKKHKSFASNPLLLTIMLMTYSEFAEIPEKLHIFYEQAFQTLYTKHDATKGAYRRELKAKLDIEDFRKVFSSFCFLTYCDGETEFSEDELITFFQTVQNYVDLPFSIGDVIDDLTHAVCAIYKEGLNYRFTHRSFQEYFTAIFLKNLSDQDMRETSLEMIQADAERMSDDEVLKMLFDMTTERVEQNIILPILEIIEQSCDTEDKYRFYYDNFPFYFELDNDIPDHEGEWLPVYSSAPPSITALRNYWYVLSMFGFLELRAKARAGDPLISNDEPLITYILEEITPDDPEYGFESSNFHEGDKMYELLRISWIGVHISFLAGLKDYLIHKSKKHGALLKRIRRTTP